MPFRRHLACTLLVALTALPAHALSGARAGGADSRSAQADQDTRERNCARYQSAITKLDMQLARTTDPSRAQRLANSKQGYQQRMRDSGCNRSLR